LTDIFLFLLKFLNPKRMKKLYSFLVIALTVSAGKMAAQTTITAAAMPQIGYVYNMMVDTAASDLPTFTVSAGSASAQTWNYSAEFANVYGETIAFVTPSSGAGSSDFPNATMAVQQPNLTDWAYFIGNSGGLYIDGAYVTAQGTQVAIDLAPNALFMATPSTYGFNNNGQSTATFTAVVQGNTFQVRHWQDRTVTADAFGSLTTPIATYPNTLRLKTFEASIDSIFVDVLGSWNFFTSQTDSTTSYMWVQNSPDAQLMQIDMDKAGVVTKAQCLQSFSNGVAQIAEPKAGFNLYPNPATHMTHLTYENKASGAVSLQMFDMSGRKIGDLLNEDQAIGKQKIFINVESMHLPKGLYFLQLKNSDGLQTVKLSVN